VSLAILIIMSAVAIPTLMRSYRAYQLSDAATRVAGIMKLTRFEAIRRNTQISCQVQQSGTNWNFAMSKGGTPLTGAQQVVVSGIVTLLPSGSVPSSASIIAALGAASPGLTTLSGGNATVTYDGRGALYFSPNPPAVYVFYLGNTAIPDLGARAVVLLPSGMVQVWTATTSSTWQRVS
jgi:Tfp pilus assembly protein FimT